MKKTSIILSVIPTKVSTIEQVVETFHNSEPESVTRKKLLRDVTVLECDFDSWWILNSKINSDENFRKLTFSKLLEITENLKQWIDIGGLIFSCGDLDHSEFVIRKISEFKVDLKELVSAYLYECDIVRCSDVKETLESKIRIVSKSISFSYHKWINICTSHIDDIVFMKFFLEVMSESVEATFEQWWRTYDLAEYNSELRELALRKMIEIKDYDSWESVRKEYDLKNNQDSELYEAAIEILSGLNSNDDDLVGDPGCTWSEVDDYLLVKEMSGRGNN